MFLLLFNEKVKQHPVLFVTILVVSLMLLYRIFK
jgi:hypothetical protein